MPTVDEILRRQGEALPTRDVFNALIQKAPIDQEARTVQVAFSSEEPVMRWFGKEILSHDPQDVDMSRLLNGAPVLVNHSMDDQVGVVESAHIDADRRGRAVLRFGKSQRAQEVFQDIIDGIRQKISFMYEVGEYVPHEDQPETYIGKNWKILEISTVSIPADDTVGVGRSLNPKIEVIEMTEKTHDPVNVEQLRAEAAKIAGQDAQARVADIMAVGAKYGLEKEAAQALSQGKTPAEFRELALEKIAERQADAPVTKLDMEKKDQERYSVMKAIRAMSGNNWKDAGLELEASIAISEKLGRNTKGFFVPFEVQSRAQATSTFGAGGALVGTDHRGDSFIDMLKANSVVMGLGVTQLSGLVGNVDIPKKVSASTAYWVDEGENVTSSQMGLGSVQLAPRTIGNAVEITRRMMLQSDPSIDMLVMGDIAREIALAIDIAILEGNGDAKPLGIVNVTGVNTQSVSSAGAPTWAELVGFETALATDNALAGNLAYVTTPAVQGSLKTTAKDSGSGLFLLEGGQANGYPVVTSSQLTANRIILGNFSDLILASWGVLEVVEDKSTLAAANGTVIRAFQDIDSAVRHAESFCINA